MLDNLNNLGAALKNNQDTTRLKKDLKAQLGFAIKPAHEELIKAITPIDQVDVMQVFQDKLALVTQESTKAEFALILLSLGLELQGEQKQIATSAALAIPELYKDDNIRATAQRKIIASGSHVNAVRFYVNLSAPQKDEFLNAIFAADKDHTTQEMYQFWVDAVDFSKVTDANIAFISANFDDANRAAFIERATELNRNELLVTLLTAELGKDPVVAGNVNAIAAHLFEKAQDEIKAVLQGDALRAFLENASYKNIMTYTQILTPQELTARITGNIKLFDTITDKAIQGKVMEAMLKHGAPSVVDAATTVLLEKIGTEDRKHFAAALNLYVRTAPIDMPIDAFKVIMENIEKTRDQGLTESDKVFITAMIAHNIYDGDWPANIVTVVDSLGGAFEDRLLQMILSNTKISMAALVDNAADGASLGALLTHGNATTYDNIIMDFKRLNVDEKVTALKNIQVAISKVGNDKLAPLFPLLAEAGVADELAEAIIGKEGLLAMIVSDPTKPGVTKTAEAVVGYAMQQGMDDNVLVGLLNLNDASINAEIMLQANVHNTMMQDNHVFDHLSAAFADIDHVENLKGIFQILENPLAASHLAGAMIARPKVLELALAQGGKVGESAAKAVAEHALITRGNLVTHLLAMKNSAVNDAIVSEFGKISEHYKQLAIESLRLAFDNANNEDLVAIFDVLGDADCAKGLTNVIAEKQGLLDLILETVEPELAGNVIGAIKDDLDFNYVIPSFLEIKPSKAILVEQNDDEVDFSEEEGVDDSIMDPTKFNATLAHLIAAAGDTLTLKTVTLILGHPDVNDANFKACIANLKPEGLTALLSNPDGLDYVRILRAATDGKSDDDLKKVFDINVSADHTAMTGYLLVSKVFKEIQQCNMDRLAITEVLLNAHRDGDALMKAAVKHYYEQHIKLSVSKGGDVTAIGDAIKGVQGVNDLSAEVMKEVFSTKVGDMQGLVSDNQKVHLENALLLDFDTLVKINDVHNKMVADRIASKGFFEWLLEAITWLLFAPNEKETTEAAQAMKTFFENGDLTNSFKVAKEREEATIGVKRAGVRMADSDDVAIKPVTSFAGKLEQSAKAAQEKGKTDALGR